MSFHQAIFFFQNMNKPWVLKHLCEHCHLEALWDKTSAGWKLQLKTCETWRLSVRSHLHDSNLPEEFGHVSLYSCNEQRTDRRNSCCPRWLHKMVVKFTAAAFSRWELLHIDNTRKPHLTYIVSKQTHASLHIMLCTRHFACLEMGVWVTSQSTRTSGAHCNLVQDQRTTARIRSASFSLLEVSGTMINEQCVTIRPSFTPLCASSEL